ncbi:peptidoglycan L-alanyl-D-glutamate endopeptidase CwlK [Elusimicrobium posterum]|uniref:hypothetical protein n=1 Tax=Elusimicrobium posterum TaxID=3116653 RepID=UPI003C71B2AF
MKNTWSKRSLERRAQLCPELQRLVDAVLAKHDCSIIQAYRGREDQAAAFAAGNSKATFGKSAHNYLPAYAVDLYPWPLPHKTMPSGALGIDWDAPAWDELVVVIKETAAELGIDIVSGADWSTLVDKPHTELANWRELIKREDAQNGKN